MKNITRKELEKVIDDIENGDENIAILETVMDNYCSNYDICEGFKYAIKVTLKDQYENHPEDQELDSLNFLMDVLNKKHPTDNEVREEMKAYNNDEVGLNNPIDFEQAKEQLLQSDKYYYLNK